MTHVGYQAQLARVLASEAEKDIEIANRVFASLEEAMHWAKRSSPHAIQGWLLFLAAQTLRSTTQMLEEIRTMATNDAQLTQAVQDLLSAYQDNTTAIEAELAAIKAKGLDGADPAIATAVTNIEQMVSEMKQSTADVQAYLNPGGTGTAGASSGGTGTAAAGTAAASGSSGTVSGTTSATGASSGADKSSAPATGGTAPAAGSSSPNAGTTTSAS